MLRIEKHSFFSVKNLLILFCIIKSMNFIKEISIQPQFDFKSSLVPYFYLCDFGLSVFTRDVTTCPMVFTGFRALDRLLHPAAQL